MSLETHGVLGQVTPAGTGTADSLIEVGAGQELLIEEIVICNTSGAAADYSIYVDDDGDEYVKGTAVFYSVTVQADTTVQIQPLWALDTAGGNIMVETSVASALTFTAFGRLVDKGNNG